MAISISELMDIIILLCHVECHSITTEVMVCFRNLFDNIGKSTVDFSKYGAIQKWNFAFSYFLM